MLDEELLDKPTNFVSVVYVFMVVEEKVRDLKITMTAINGYLNKTSLCLSNRLKNGHLQLKVTSR